jgi:hypothetical protein
MSWLETWNYGNKAVERERTFYCKSKSFLLYICNVKGKVVPVLQ